MIWGVNIHRSYANLSQAGVLSLAVSLGLKSVRVDVYDASVDTRTYLSGLIAAATPLGISIAPVLVPSEAASSTEQYAFNWGYSTARSLALVFPQISWEAGNELDMFCIRPGASGERSADYDTAKYNRCRGSIQGMYAGFRAVSPMPVGVGIAGLHFAFLDRLRTDGVQWDITTWHIYMPPGATDIATGASTLFAKLALYGKPIAITEFNQQDGHLSTLNPQTLLDMMAAIDAQAASKKIVAAYIYELLDEPHLQGGEATYGLASTNGALNALGNAVQLKLVGR